MADPSRTIDGDVPNSGKVNQVCEEWKIREDGALAYRLQNEEISEHYSGNKYRNALVREDFPKAKHEQLKEQKLAEEAAAIYQKMLAEQEEMDSFIAKQLADKLQTEEHQKRRVLELYDEHLARKLLHKEREKGNSHSNTQRHNAYYTPREMGQPEPRQEYRTYPQDNSHFSGIVPDTQPEVQVQPAIEHADPNDFEDSKMIAKLIQEEKDAELARKLQEEEEYFDDATNKDRLLAIEAQDKELARLLQEREKAKARKARERQKQKQEQRNQARKSDSGPRADHLVPRTDYLVPRIDHLAPRTDHPVPRTETITRPDPISPQAEYLLPDDTYSYPLDVLPSTHVDMLRNYPQNNYVTPESLQEDSYSLPLDVIPTNKAGVKYSRHGDLTEDIPKTGSYKSDVVRPTHLNLKYSHNDVNKIDAMINPENARGSQQHSPAKINIAMVVDPTYNKSGMSSTLSSTSTSSSSPSCTFMSYDSTGHSSDATVPPYMPIQGHKRITSLEKKPKRRNKDGGCKQQ